MTIGLICLAAVLLLAFLRVPLHTRPESPCRSESPDGLRECAPGNR